MGEQQPPQLSEEMKGAIRGYMLSLVALPTIVVSLIFFALGIFVRDWGAKIGEVEAYREANRQLAGFVEKVSEARFNAQQASSEARSIAANLKIAQAQQSSTDSRVAVAE